MTEFLAMGGYGAFIWPCYGLAALVLLGFLFTTLRDLRERERRLIALESQRPSRRPGRHAGPGVETSRESGIP